MLRLYRLKALRKYPPFLFPSDLFPAVYRVVLYQISVTALYYAGLA